MTEALRSQDDRHASQPCAECGKQGRLIVSSPIVLGFSPYYDEFAGEYFESREDKARKLKAKRLVEAGRGGGDIKRLEHDKRGRIYSAAAISRRGSNPMPYQN